MNIVAPTSMDAWKLALAKLLAEGKNFKDDNKRICREILNFSVTIQHPEIGADEPIDLLKGFDKWLYPSKEELANIIFNKDVLPLYEYTYGSRLFNYKNSLNQINNYIIPLLTKNPSSRRATVIVMDPLSDLKIQSKNAPALVSLHFKMDDNMLLLTAVVRSNDFFIGWPANLYQFFLLQHYVAEQLGLREGSITTYSISAHIFEEYFNDINSVLEK